MSDCESYDLLILGGGKAGKTLAMDRRKAGKRVAVVEAGMIGGSCINIACIPTKALVRSGPGRASRPGRAGEYGVVQPANRPSTWPRRGPHRRRSWPAWSTINAKAFAESGFELVLGGGGSSRPG